jgi:hypothetical protein
MPGGRKSEESRVDITGQRYGMLVVKAHSHRALGGNHWLCVCDCGKERVVRIGSLRKKKSPTRSCGCLTGAHLRAGAKLKTLDVERAERKAEAPKVDKGAVLRAKEEAARFIAWVRAGSVVCCVDAVMCHARGRCIAGEKERAA